MYILQIKSNLSARSYFTVAVTAIHWSVFAWLKRDFRILTTLGTNRGEHLTRRPITVSTASVALWLPCFTARGTTFWLISIAFGLEKLLFLNAKRKGSPTIGTLERLLFKTHWMTSSLYYLVRVLATQYLRKTEMLNSLCDNQYL